MEERRSTHDRVVGISPEQNDYLQDLNTKIESLQKDYRFALSIILAGFSIKLAKEAKLGKNNTLIVTLDGKEEIPEQSENQHEKSQTVTLK